MKYVRVSEEMRCKSCHEWIPSDQLKWEKHIIKVHGKSKGDYLHNIARLYVDKEIPARKMKKPYKVKALDY
jgi:threonine synthase